MTSTTRSPRTSLMSRIFFMTLYSYWFGFFLHMCWNINKVHTVQVVNTEGEPLVTDDGSQIIGYLVAPTSPTAIIFFITSAIYAFYKVVETSEGIVEADDVEEAEQVQEEKPKRASIKHRNQLKEPLLPYVQVV
mmetsp:Transcript_23500/g.34823  ORF Transcript_23500/g.34823 Transcript_23500/m.34823 type:complete len:134 (-) Transcript_23500:138-539(-)|eukprot:CAMPEP_0194031964 /NCGR_PEP_ID=MMETSP0009_2-20130614/5016_1 /TAXON_ID=210454 /ORGANISM="Grammatophora oceanica, Strain CCMP 410" /LENGTH=133 /DNA_ID=CAMNT_0038672261 /DNA_START=247 /DNA_END=648 /DNA_ORIENTATION=+